MAVQPASPIGLAVEAVDLQRHLQLATIDLGDGGNALLESYIVTATEFLERSTGTVLSQRAFTLTLDGFPRERSVSIPRPPLVRIASVSYLDTAGETQTLPTDQYVVDANSQPGRLLLRSGLAWPQTLDVPASVTVTFTAGSDMLPPLLRHAVLMLAGHFYGNREATSDRRVNDVPFAVQSIIDLHAHQAVA